MAEYGTTAVVLDAPTPGDEKTTPEPEQPQDEEIIFHKILFAHQPRAAHLKT